MRSYAVPRGGVAKLLPRGGLEGEPVSTLTYAGANLIENHAPILATLNGRGLRPPVNLSGPCALDVVFGHFQTRQQLRGQHGALIGLKRLSEDIASRVSHVAILHDVFTRRRGGAEG